MTKEKKIQVQNKTQRRMKSINISNSAYYEKIVSQIIQLYCDKYKEAKSSSCSQEDNFN